MTVLYDHAASKAKTAENDAVPPNKKAKKLNSTKPPSKPVKAIKQEAADNSAGAFPDLTNAPTHGPDEPLLLEHGSAYEGDSSCAISNMQSSPASPKSGISNKPASPLARKNQVDNFGEHFHCLDHIINSQRCLCNDDVYAFSSHKMGQISLFAGISTPTNWWMSHQL